MTSDDLEPDLLSAALREHNAGRFQEAKDLYVQALSQSPDHPDALHLLGVLTYQQGDHDRAVVLIRRAIEHLPHNAAFHANLAEAHRALRQYEQAIACCQEALRLQPESPQVRNNLGMALMDLGRAAEAHDQFAVAVMHDPQSPLLHNNLGNALRMLHRHQEAVHSFRKALELQPQMAEAQSNLGQLLFELGQHEQALVHCRQAVRLAPQLSAPLNNLGNVLRKLGQLDEATKAYAEAIRLQPGMGMAHNNIGQVLEEEGSLDEAIVWFRQAIERDPNSPHIHTSLGRALANRDDHDPEAITHFQRALELDPSFAEAHDAWGAMLIEQGKIDEAMHRLHEALRYDGGLASAHANLGRCLRIGGQDEDAIACFQKAIDCDPLNTSALTGLASAAGADVAEGDVQKMQQLIDRRLVSARKRSDLHFALANVRDAQRWFSVAAIQAQQANSIRHQLDIERQRAWDPHDHIEMVDRLIRAFGCEFFQQTRGWGLDTEVPVFHVGLPRSGKSLAEQVLAAHPDTHGAGELQLGNQSFMAFPKVLGVDDPPIDCVGRWTEATVAQVAETHLSALKSLAPSAARVIDTMPHNYLALGVIATLFPRAKIVHCRRDLRDVALACWFKNFKHLRWSCNVEHLAVRIEQYCRIMEHWRAALPIPLFELDYEDMVTDPGPAARRLVEFVGLAWHDDCGKVFERQRPRAAGHWDDARPPFTSEFIGRWQRYETALAPLFKSLSEIDPRR